MYKNCMTYGDYNNLIKSVTVHSSSWYEAHLVICNSIKHPRLIGATLKMVHNGDYQENLQSLM